MKILSLDSSTGFASVALTEDGELLHLVQDRSGHTHSETLLPMIVSALEKHGMTPKDIDLFACVVGPGSYTGVRIGVATVKGLASGSGKPCIPVSSLEALAENGPFEGLICPVIDARRDQMYTALFERKNRELRRLTEDRLLPLVQIGKELKKKNRKVYLAGDGCEKTEKALNCGKIRALPALLRDANAYSAAMCALRRFSQAADGAEPAAKEEKGQKPFDEESLCPVYLRATQAERERLEKMRENPGAPEA